MYAMIGLFVVILVSSSCATGPTKVNASLVVFDGAHSFVPLSPGASVYAAVDIGKARKLLERILKNSKELRAASEMIDKTETAWIAFYPDNAPQNFMIVADGAYPSGKANMSFSFSSEWKKRSSPSGGTYWYSADERIALALNARQLFLSDGDPLASPPGVAIPDDFAVLSADSALAFWLDDAALINQIFESLDIPIQIPAKHTFIVIRPSPLPNYYDTDINFELFHTTQAKGLVAVFSLARRSINLAEPLAHEELAVLFAALFTNPPVQEGTHLLIRAATLSETEIPLLFNTFASFSKKEKK
ncbi:MAG: hypothetical protein LBO67_01615 [Spirochaetaceae bacterium]|jgi:hypothetical protein|nr:hypothetical protein [Spirochaetaceae bacterium]